MEMAKNVLESRLPSSRQVPLNLSDRQVHPLYRHLLHTVHATLAVIGVPIKVLPFPLFDLQVRFFCNHLAGEFTLPSKAEMDAFTEAEKARRKEQGRCDSTIYLESSLWKTSSLSLSSE
jgi:hypothetical protein